MIPARERLQTKQNTTIVVQRSRGRKGIKSKDENIVETINPDIEKIAELDSRGLIVSAKGETTDFTSRVFGPNVGVDEDPVTGSAHALLATYWGDVLNLQKMKARQASKRGGELICEVLENNVEITGKAKLYLQGEIYF